MELPGSSVWKKWALCIFSDRVRWLPGFAGHFDVTFASISRHLSLLKDADLIRDRRDGKFIYYELNASVLEEVLLWIYDLKGEKNEEI